MEPGKIAERVKQFQVQQISVRGRKAAIGPKPNMTKLECIRKHRENIRKCAADLGIEWTNEGAIVPTAQAGSPTRFADEDVSSYLQQCAVSPPPHEQPRSAPATSSTAKPPWSIAQPSSLTRIPSSTFSPPRRVPSPARDPSPPERYASPTVSSSARARQAEQLRCLSPRCDRWFDQQRQDRASPMRLSPSPQTSSQIVRSPPTRKSSPRSDRPKSPVAARYDDVHSTAHARGGSPCGGASGSATPAEAESDPRTGDGLVDVNRSVEDLLAQWRAQHLAFQQEGISVLPAKPPEIVLNDSFSDADAVLRRIKLRLGVNDTSDLIADPCAFAAGEKQRPSPRNSLNLSADNSADDILRQWRLFTAAPAPPPSSSEKKPVDDSIFPRPTTESTMPSRTMEDVGNMFVAAPAADKEVVFLSSPAIPPVKSIDNPILPISPHGSDVLEAPQISPRNNDGASSRELVGSARVPPLELPISDYPSVASVLPAVTTSSSPRAAVAPILSNTLAVGGDTTPTAVARKVEFSSSPLSVTSFLDNLTSQSQQSSNGLLDLITLPPDVAPISQPYERIRDSILSLSRDSNDTAAVTNFFARANGESVPQWPHRYDFAELEEEKKLEDLHGRYIAAVVERTHDGGSAAAVVKSVDVAAPSTALPVAQSPVSNNVERHPRAPDASAGSGRQTGEDNVTETAPITEIADRDEPTMCHAEHRDQVIPGATMESRVHANASPALVDGAAQHINATWRQTGKEEATQTSFDFGESFVSLRQGKRDVRLTEESGHGSAGCQNMDERYPWDHVERILRHLPQPPSAPPVPHPRRAAPIDDGVLKTYMFFRQQQHALLAR